MSLTVFSTLLNCVRSQILVLFLHVQLENINQKVVSVETEEDHKRLLDDVDEAVEVTSATQLVEGDQTQKVTFGHHSNNYRADL